MVEPVLQETAAGRAVPEVKGGLVVPEVVEPAVVPEGVAVPVVVLEVAVEIDKVLYRAQILEDDRDNRFGALFPKALRGWFSYGPGDGTGNAVSGPARRNRPRKFCNQIEMSVKGRRKPSYGHRIIGSLESLSDAVP